MNRKFIIAKLRKDERGVATIEMALTLPILLTFIYGIFQVGVILAANAGMQHALGEGARYATLFPTPTNQQIAERIEAKKFGAYVGLWTAATVNNPPSGTTGYRDLSIGYSVTPNFLFFNGPAIAWTRQKRVYLST
ncbi:MAG: pilus assembly protein [Sphingomonas bacterium]|nr:pilus assembly protein [Sphingomonas bacterium]